MLKSRIANDLKFVNQIGATLSAHERLGLELGLLRLEQAQSFDSVLFWGRVEGLNRNYYVCYGLKTREQYEFPKQTFFWSTEEFQFSALPDPLMQFAKEVFALRDYFSGLPQKILIRDVEPARSILLTRGLQGGHTARKKLH